MTSPLVASVRAGWCGFSTPLEGCKAFPYLDTHDPPIVTTAIGCALESFSAFCAVPWQVDERPADVGEMRAGWQALAYATGGRLAEHYEPLTRLRLTPDGIEQLVLARLAADAVILAARWPAFATFPAPAQAALCSLAWAVGPGASGHGLTGHEWPHLQAAVDAQDWFTAARTGVLSAENNPGIVPRDTATGALFLMAAGLPAPPPPAGPSSDAARRALAAFTFEAFDSAATLDSSAPVVDVG